MSVTENIKQKLEANFNPEKLEIIDESQKHIGHSGYNEQGESHFHILIVSDRFEGLSRLDRQRIVYKTLETELADRVHALSLKCMSPLEK